MHNKISTLTVLLTITSLFFVIGNYDSAFACECQPPLPPAEELQRSAAVFSGKVVEIRDNPSKNGYEVEFDIERSWKGGIDNTAVIITAFGSAACGYEFEQDEKYLVYAYKSDGPLHTTICNRTTPLADAQEDLQFLDTAWLVYKLKFEDQVFKIPYRITNVNLRWMEMDPDFGSIIIRVAAENDGTLELMIPRNLFDPTADGMKEEFIVIVDGEEEEEVEVEPSACFRTFSVDIPGGAEDIDIIGGTVFGPYPPTEVPPVHLSTDKTYYSQGDLVMISGCTNLALNANEVILEVRNPEEKIYRIMSIRPSATGEFSTSMIIKGELAVNGTYTVKASYAGEGTTSTFVVPEFPVNLMIVAAVGLVAAIIALRLNMMSKQIKEFRK